ncbi:peptidoglycan-binding protein [Streptomyces sp. NPDC006711]|uniref:peptidoglycan-binding protein n=1 Tax=Streptomyces sp. NPDC006711 TaxID=3364762 RepID=UPI00369B8E0F
MEASTPGPVFEDYEPPGDCGCPGCADGRRRQLLPVRDGGHPAAHGGARRALVAATAASMVLGTATAAAAAPLPGPEGPGANRAADPGPPTQQGATSGLHGAPGHGANSDKPRPTTRAEIIDRAKVWVAAAVPYDMEAYWTDGYRQDCSGYVSMAWDLGTNEWTGSLAKFGVRVTRDELQPGDILLFHNPADPTKGSHVVIFGGWTDQTHTYYTAYEQTPPNTRSQTTPYAYWKNSSRYVPYRYKGIKVSAPATPVVTPTTPAVPAKPTTTTPTAPTTPTSPPTSTTPPASTTPAAPTTPTAPTAPATPTTPAAPATPTSPAAPATPTAPSATPATPAAPAKLSAEPPAAPTQPVAPAATPPTSAAPTAPTTPGVAAKPAATATPAGTGVKKESGAGGAVFPGADKFGPGADNPHVTRLGRMLVRRGGKRFYGEGPGPRWGIADRNATRAFQEAQGWSGADADGIPGAATWSLLVRGTGRNIPADQGGRPALDAADAAQTARPASWTQAPTYPGPGLFRPGQSSPYVTQLGRQLVRKGFGAHYTDGPGPRWGEADRRNVEAFQRAQGWRGAEADGYPGPETWRRLFA